MQLVFDKVGGKVAHERLLRIPMGNPGGGSTLIRVREGKGESMPKHGRATETTDGLPGQAETVGPGLYESPAVEPWLCFCTRQELQEAQNNDPYLKIELNWLSELLTRPKGDDIHVDSHSPAVRNLWVII